MILRKNQLIDRLEAYRSNLTLYMSRFGITDIREETSRIERALAVLNAPSP